MAPRGMRLCPRAPLPPLAALFEPPPFSPLGAVLGCDRRIATRTAGPVSLIMEKRRGENRDVTHAGDAVGNARPQEVGSAGVRPGILLLFRHALIVLIYLRAWCVRGVCRQALCRKRPMGSDGADDFDPSANRRPLMRADNCHSSVSVKGYKI
ncbi:hypothetical protein SKAU_G00013840 [Synaphobranchus kaupii]|uniref:Uncharacterized protein n=1 Tax=Synaphobranchus kaupii TaxID=118154 RepID=A0A9Q1JBH6_SYNKA|nr:hypothetical protein SKAU_G00013840 [Synaphobranchus kaupii]